MRCRFLGLRVIEKGIRSLGDGFEGVRGSKRRHTGASINGQLTLFVDGSTQTAVVATGIITLGVAQWVIDMFGGLVAAQTLGGDFKFPGTIAKGRRRLA